MYRHIMDDVYVMCMMQRYLTPHIKGSCISTFHGKGSVIFVNEQVPLCFFVAKTIASASLFLFSRLSFLICCPLCVWHFPIHQQFSSLLALLPSFLSSLCHSGVLSLSRAEGASPKPRCPFPSSSQPLPPPIFLMSVYYK